MSSCALGPICSPTLPSPSFDFNFLFLRSVFSMRPQCKILQTKNTPLDMILGKQRLPASWCYWWCYFNKPLCNPTNILFDISYTYIHTRPYINTCICMYGSVHAQASLLVRGGEWVNVMYVSSSTTKSAPYKNNKLSSQRPNDDISKWKKNREKGEQMLAIA